MGPGSGETGTDLESRAAYLTGLVRGLDLQSVGPEGRVLEHVVELLGDVVKEVADLRRVGSTRSGPAARVANLGVSPLGQERDLFLACECPYCGKDIFVNTSGAGRREAGSPEDLRELVLTCTNCGERLHVVMKLAPTRAGEPHPLGLRAVRPRGSRRRDPGPSRPH